MPAGRLQSVRCHVSGLRVLKVARLAILADHRESCLRCQAEVAREKRLQRHLRSLADVTVAAPASVAAGVIHEIQRAPGLVHEAGHVSPWSWVVPAAAAAGCAMALAVARRAMSAV